MKLKPGEVLVPDFDHRYRIARINEKATVAWSEKAQTFFEYAGDEYLENDEVAVEAPVVD